MTVGRLLLWRHGRTAFNATARLQGQVDIPLDDVGRWQARTAAAAMLVRHTPTRIVSSDLGRAVETADPLARMAGVDVETDERVRERSFGEWEGLSGPEIARRLFVSVNTLRTHTKHIFTKLDVNSRQEAVRRARELGVI